MWPRNAEEAIGWPVKLNLNVGDETHQLNGEITAYRQSGEFAIMAVRTANFTFQVTTPMSL